MNGLRSAELHKDVLVPQIEIHNSHLVCTLNTENSLDVKQTSTVTLDEGNAQTGGILTKISPTSMKCVNKRRQCHEATNPTRRDRFKC